jgi:hypothetical protein
MAKAKTLNFDELLGMIGGGGSSDRGARLGQGNTVLYIIAAPKGVGGVMAPTHSVYNGEVSERFAFWAHVVSCDDPKGMPDGFTARVVPLVVPPTVARGLVGQFKDGCELSQVDWKTGKMTGGTAFRIKRYKDGNFTKYEVAAPRTFDNNPPAFPEVLTMPESTLDVFAKEYGEWQDRNAAKYALTEEDKAVNAMADELLPPAPDNGDVKF